MEGSIFKYFRGDDYTLDALINKYLWFSMPPYLNDPFDCSMEHLVTRDSPLSDKAKNFILDKTKEFGICCFSEEPLIHHLWSFYANGHQGFCVEFDREAIKSFYSKKFQAKCDLLRCDYRLIPLNLNGPIEWIFHEDGSITSFPLANILSEDKKRDQLFEMLLLQKNAGIWQNEKEWRIILGGRAILNGAKEYSQESKGYKIPLPENAIKSMVLPLS